MPVITAAGLNSSTCPPWCRSHTGQNPEPAGHHLGIAAELSDADLILSDLPGEGPRATLVGPDGQVTLSPADWVRLSRIFGRLTAAVVSAASA